MGKLLHRWKYLPESWRFFLVFCAIMFPLRSSFADWNFVPTGSMKPTLLEGDEIFVNKLAYDLKVPFTTLHIAQWGDPRRGDIVVFYSPEDGIRLVKRVIGLPGDTIEMRDQALIINGQPVAYENVITATPSQSDLLHENAAVLAREVLPSRNHEVLTLPAVSAMRSFGPLTVPDNHYFMLGDSRDNSKDSRYIGFVPRTNIVGRATHLLVSLDIHNYYRPRFDRFLSTLE
jgi:signal peptidase I